ncbi:FAD dependent oxidoreductase [Sporobacter termitidis DSM 10068]|uniref:FAD dependent oxidoreductase n=2 Tax=Sporobacter TaxID=44748 RepID=A0A1M5UC12_9FIRM|nr:FAD dependent oxidoreductase [Sporobacter termitidis DSM 10068]
MVRDYKYDVIVCGGGTSGVSAAIAAARGGAKTLLIERLGALGGQMNVFGPPGFSYAYLYNEAGERVIDGFIGETHERLLKENHARPTDMNAYRSGSDYIFSFVDPEWWGLLIYEMMTENNVNLLLHSLVVDVIKDGSGIHGVVVENAAGRQYFEAKVVIECTGEGDIAVRAGCEYELLPREENEPHTVCFTLDGINWDETLAYIKAHPDQILPRGDMDRTPEERYELIRNVKDIAELGDMLGFFDIMNEAIKNGDWHPYAGMGFFIGPKPDGNHLQAHCQHSAQVPNLWSCDPWDLTYGEVENRRQIKIAVNAFRKYMPGFQNAYLTKMGIEMRLRDGRRIMGDYVLGWDDVAEGRRHFDCIGKSTFSAGAVHVADNRTIAASAKGTVKPPNKGTYDLPYRMLVPRKIENLLIAGKHVSAERCAYQRFLQETMVSGQAAGAAAALCVKHGVTPRQLEAENYIKELQDVLRSQRVILDGVR